MDDLTPPHWGTDEFVEPKPGETFNLDRALSLAVAGYRVRATNMQEGAYIDYQFSGWRINFPGGSSSGWTPRDLDRVSEWVEVPIETARPIGEIIKPIVADIEAKAKANWGFTPGAGTQPTPQPANVGKWGPPQPAKDKWGRPA